MYLGYQNNKIVLVANTRAELENAPCIKFDEIVETDKEYALYNGEYLLKEEVEQAEQAKATEARIAELKQLLADTDYKAIKYAEGLISDEEYAETKAQRQAWRDEINELQGEEIEETTIVSEEAE